MGAKFMQYAKPLDLNVMRNEMEQRKASYEEDYETVMALLPALEKWEGKKINRRIAGQAEALFPGRRVYLEKTITGMMHLVIESPVNKSRIYLCYRSTDSFDYQDFVNDKLTPHKNCKKFADRIGEGLKALPELVEEYNRLLEAQQALVKRATMYHMEYDFDILSRET